MVVISGSHRPIYDPKTSRSKKEFKFIRNAILWLPTAIFDGFSTNFAPKSKSKSFAMNNCRHPQSHGPIYGPKISHGSRHTWFSKGKNQKSLSRQNRDLPFPIWNLKQILKKQTKLIRFLRFRTVFLYFFRIYNRCKIGPMVPCTMASGRMTKPTAKVFEKNKIFCSKSSKS